MSMFLVSGLLLLAAPAAAADSGPDSAPPELPESVRRMVEAAARTGDKAKIDAVVAIAKETNHGVADEIDRVVASVAAARKAEREARLAEASMFDNWKGSGQAGAALSTGNSNTRSLTIGLNLERPGLKWRHRANILVDLVDSDVGADQERILGGYQIDYRFSDRAYSWARFEYERNRQAGIRRRFAESAGFGLRALAPEPVSWDLELGPAVRQTRLVDHVENAVAVRGASRLRWAVSRSTTFTNDTAVFWENAGSVTNTAALTSKMFGPLSARLSYNLAWEQEPPPGLNSLDTTSRVTLVYSF